MAKYPVTITLHMSELLYDIDNETWLVGESQFNGENRQAVSLMQSGEDEESRNHILRDISTAIGNLSSALKEYQFAGNEHSSNLLLSADDDIVVSLAMPGNFDISSVSALTEAIHQYIVNFAISRWFGATAKDEAARYSESAAAYLSQVREIVGRRVRPGRPQIL